MRSPSLVVLTYEDEKFLTLPRTPHTVKSLAPCVSRCNLES